MRTSYLFPATLPLMVCAIFTLAVPMVGLVANPLAQMIGPPVVVDDSPCTYPHAFHGMGMWGITWFPLDTHNEAQMRLYSAAMVERADIIDTDLSDDWSFPAAAASDDHTLLVYSSGDYGADIYRLVAVLFDRDGNQLDRVYLDDLFDFPYRLPKVVNRSGTNEFLVIYNQKEESPPQNVYLWGVIVATDGGQIHRMTAPTPYGPGSGYYDLYEPDLVWGLWEVMPGVGQERYFIVYHSDNAPAGRSVMVDGTLVGGEVDFPLIDNGGCESPAIAGAEGSGETNVIVTWTYSDIYGQPMIAAQRIDVAGHFEGSAFTVSSWRSLPDVAASDTEYLFVFKEEGVPVTEDRLWGQYCDFDGVSMGDPFIIVDNDSDRCFRPSVASDGVNFLVTYQTGSSTTVPTDQTVVAQRVGAGAFTYVDSDVSSAGDASRGVAWSDWNAIPAQRFPDLFVANTTTEENLTFENVDGYEFNQRTTGASENLSAQGAAFGDYDDDGNLDLYVSSDTGANELYHRVITPDYFEPVGSALGVNDTGVGRSVAWGDYDGDGWLDLYVGNRSGSPINRLYHNPGAGQPFTEVGAALGVADAGHSEGVAFIDFDDDSDLDIYVGNAGSANRLFRYHGGTYQDVASAWQVDDDGSARSVSWCDYDNDGDFDLYISKYNQANSLYRNEGEAGYFRNRAAALGVDDAGRGESACWADFDLDGDRVPSASLHDLPL